jgi:hypothetical protein
MRDPDCDHWPACGCPIGACDVEIARAKASARWRRLDRFCTGAIVALVILCIAGAVTGLFLRATDLHAPQTERTLP